MLRRATEKDLDLLETLAHRIWWAHYPSIISEAQIRYMLGMNYSPESLRMQLAEGQQFWIIEPFEQGPLGFVGISLKSPSEAFIHKFYIDAPIQGQGIGKAAFQELLLQYPALKTIRLFVNRQNYKSVNFYFKIGFHIEKCIETPIGQGFVMDDFQMRYGTP